MCQSLRLCLTLLTVAYRPGHIIFRMLSGFAKLHFFIYLHGIVKITTNRTTDKCQLLLKSCYSVGYNYQIYRCIFKLAAININVVIIIVLIFMIFPSMLLIYADNQAVHDIYIVT